MKNTIKYKSMRQRTGASITSSKSLALVFGLAGLLAAESYISGIQSVAAGPAKVEAVQIADFSGIVKSVSPAVVSVTTRTEVKITRAHKEFFKGMPGFGFTPNAHTEFEFIPDGMEFPTEGMPGFGIAPNAHTGFEFIPDGLEFEGIPMEMGVPDAELTTPDSAHVIPGMKEIPEILPGFKKHPKGFPDLANLPQDHQLMQGVTKFGDEPGVNRPGTKVWSYSQGQGSGFFISEDGFVVTNEHVVRDANEIKVITNSGDVFDAELIGVDERTDLALLKVDADREFTYVQFAEDKPNVGEWVVTVGNPFGLGGTVTAGIVSAHGRDIGSGPYDDFIQIDAPVNNGNSGGPAFNLRGEVIGVNTAIFSPSGGNVGIAFVIPSSTTEDVVMDLMDDGAVVRGWLGVHVQSVSEDIAESIGLDDATGALITEPQPNSPAAVAGLQSGDTILWVNDIEIGNPRDLARVIAAHTPGTKVDLTILRDGSEDFVTVELGQLPDDPANNDRIAGPSGKAELSSLGFEVESAKEVGKADEGVVITSIKPGSTADIKNLRKGTVILEIAGETVNTPEDVASKIGEAKAEGRSAVLLRLQFEDGTRFVALPIERT